ncbi:MAG TPA: hypothetical protein ACHBX6_13225 [Arsenophonus nasoniae]|uniref:hypothetical protein n=1 Tax=Arsenophonus nasoniae TaxID=638 RepID=UPI00387A5C30
MKINRKLNLVVPVDLNDETSGFIHSTSISKEIFQKHVLILAKTYSFIFSENLNAISGPRVAYFLLKQIAESQGEWEGKDGVENTLINEIIRLSNLVYPKEKKGYDTMPLEVAIEKELIDIDEAINELVFFTCFSVINKPAQLAIWMERLNLLWNCASTPLNVMEWITSIKTSNVTANTGEMEKPSSQKSSTIVPA